MSNWIKKDIEFETKYSLVECKRLTMEFFQNLGFKNPMEELNSIHYKRGSEFQNGFVTNPLKWMSKIKLRFNESIDSVIVNGGFDINTKNQLATQKELELWNLLIENFKNSLLEGKVELTKISERNKKVSRGTLGIVIWAIFGAILGCGLGMFLTFVTELTFFLPLFTIAFSLIFLINAMKKSNNGLQQRL